MGIFFLSLYLPEKSNNTLLLDNNSKPFKIESNKSAEEEVILVVAAQRVVNAENTI